MVPLRQELNRTKDTYSKERMARLSAQQETSMLKDQLLRLEKINEDLERDVKSIPALADSNELLKADLQRIRNRYVCGAVRGTQHTAQDVMSFVLSVFMCAYVCAAVY